MPRFYQPLPKLQQLDLATPAGIYTERKKQKKLDEYKEQDFELREKQINATLSNISSRNIREEERLRLDKDRAVREAEESKGRIATEKLQQQKALFEHRQAREDHVFDYADRLIKGIDTSDPKRFIEQKNSIWRSLEAMVAEDYPEGIPPANLAALKTWYDNLTPERVTEIKNAGAKFGQKVTLTSEDGKWTAELPYGSPEFKQMYASGKYKIGQPTATAGGGKGDTSFIKNVEYIKNLDFVKSEEQAVRIAKTAMSDPLEAASNYADQAMEGQKQAGIYPENDGYKDYDTFMTEGIKALKEYRRQINKAEGGDEDPKMKSSHGNESLPEGAAFGGINPETKKMEYFDAEGNKL